MRLDTEVIKGLLSDLAKAGGQLDAAGVQSFAADVHAQLGRAEAVLKVVGSPPEKMVDTFFELLPHGSPSDFQRMADLKVGGWRGWMRFGWVGLNAEAPASALPAAGYACRLVLGLGAGAARLNALPASHAVGSH